MSGLDGVWAGLVGQQPTVAVLRSAAAAAARRLAGGDGTGMTHAFLVTGPPGSGRSNVARAFAAALQCADGGCGRCAACRSALAGAHPDVTLVRTEQLSIRVEQIRELVRKAAMTPVLGRFQVLVVEDADRLTEPAADALLKSLEEPGARTIWLLCTPTATDVVPTIRSRCRLLVLRTPPTAEVAAMLERAGATPELAAFAAAASQGHVGRARALASDDAARARRAEVLDLPDRLGSVPTALAAAAALVAAATAEAKDRTEESDARERAELERALGVGTPGVRVRHAQAALRELAEEQKVRARRLVRDAVDRALVDLVSYFRDVLVVALGARVGLVNVDRRDRIEAAGRELPAEAALAAVDAILACREAITANVAPQLAVESLAIALRDVLTGAGAPA